MPGFASSSQLTSFIAKANRMRYRVVIERDEDGVFVAEVPSLPGCISQSGTRLEAFTNVCEAIELYLESLAAHGEPVPPSISEDIIEVKELING
ncbi:type II toxin-antitoxin system HicB family antitoxin [Candidatus Thiosymbion oneisti]|uniref:type II toxin-antitoxin system HicB family antitoxin n=1 Tax=Candidatus Thiosymbion oneisti TaxID=589554 RepID=UPI00210DC433|nr:type II toxin-antitoxin system HicB family antitoxin [Candidatus Thiosymbion oneisti]